jgi:hypothetical protein
MYLSNVFSVFCSRRRRFAALPSEAFKFSSSGGRRPELRAAKAPLSAPLVSVSARSRCHEHMVLVVPLRLVCCRYLDWKQHTLLHLDYFAGVFCMSYLTVLIYKTLKQPSTVYYLLYILIKTLPHVPLMMGFRSTYLRCGRGLHDIRGCSISTCNTSCSHASMLFRTAGEQWCHVFRW